MLVTLILGMIITAASVDNTEVASFQVNGAKIIFTVGDLKSVISSGAFQGNIDIDNLSDVSNAIFERSVIYQIILQDQIAQGLTNDSAFAAKLEKEKKRDYYLTMNTAGYFALTNEIMSEPVEVARASVIYLSNDLETNMSAAKQKRLDKLMKAIRQSKNLKQDFPVLVSRYSEDSVTRNVAGDAGYYIKRNDMNPVEREVFGIGKKRYSKKPMMTPYGALALYITEPAKKMKLKELQARLGDGYKKYQRSFINEAIKEYLAKQITNYYELRLSNFSVLVDGKDYPVSDIPESVKMAKVFNTVYTWKELKSIILIFVPDFTNQTSAESRFDSFMMQMNNFDNFIIFVEKAKSIGYQDTAEYRKAIKDSIEKTMIQEAAERFQDKLMNTITATIDDAQLISYYTNHLAKYSGEKLDKDGNTVVDASGKPVMEPMNYQEAKGMVYSDLKLKLMMDTFEKWKTEASIRYGFRIELGGLKALVEECKKEILSRRK